MTVIWVAQWKSGNVFDLFETKELAIDGVQKEYRRLIEGRQKRNVEALHNKIKRLQSRIPETATDRLSWQGEMLEIEEKLVCPSPEIPQPIENEIGTNGYHIAFNGVQWFDMEIRPRMIRGAVLEISS